jgi:hypothetical protein
MSMSCLIKLRATVSDHVRGYLCSRQRVIVNLDLAVVFPDTARKHGIVLPRGLVRCSIIPSASRCHLSCLQPFGAIFNGPANPRRVK